MPRREYDSDMKTIAVFFDAPGYSDYPFNDQYYVDAYHEIATRMQKKGGKLIIVRDQKTYKGNNVFAGSWDFDGKTFVRNDAAVTVDLIYDKGHFVPDASARMSNDRAMDEICVDKFKTFEMFPEASPLTLFVSNKEEFDAALKKFTDMVVAKPVNLEGGYGVFIGPVSEVAAKVTTFPYILQEFMDTSGGIPGLVEGMHDFRMVGVDGTIVASYIRTPPPGKMTANVSQGGKQVEVRPDAIPAEARALFDMVDARFNKYGRRVYSVDCARLRDGTWKIIELNSKPAVSPVSQGPNHEIYQERLSDALLS